MDEELKLKITKAELGVLYLAVCELIDTKFSGFELNRVGFVDLLINLKEKLHTVAKQ